jgi:hypothetical protein
MLVIVFGPPAVGKMTVGLELERLTGFRLFHRHTWWAHLEFTRRSARTRGRRESEPRLYLTQMAGSLPCILWSLGRGIQAG